MQKNGYFNNFRQQFDDNSDVGFDIEIEHVRYCDVEF